MNGLVPITGFKVGEWEKKIPRDCLLDRDTALVDICIGKSVLHIGAADSPFHMEKGRRGELLHQKIMQVASSVIGIDVDEEAVRQLHEINIDNIIVADINENTTLEGKVFDVVLCCDIIEHVLNPGEILEACRRFLRQDSKLVISTINATALKPALRALKGREAVHDDHICYFSYSTLCQMLVKNMYRPTDFGTFHYPTVLPAVSTIWRWLGNFAPGTADGIIVLATSETTEG
jgi:2-polyprenyl-3-methyl-5-hydroxy-6-metoxy-1,4-benzoquinol methylase